MIGSRSVLARREIDRSDVAQWDDIVDTRPFQRVARQARIERGLQIIDFGAPTDDAANAMSLIGEVESTLQSMTR